VTSRERVRAVYAFKAPDRVPYFELTVNHPVASRVLGREATCGFGGYVRGKVQNTLMTQGRRDEWVERFTTDSLATAKTLGFDILLMQWMPARGEKWDLKEVGPNTWLSGDRDGWYSVSRWDPSTDFYGEVESSFARDPERELRDRIAGLKAEPKARVREGSLDYCHRARKEFPDHFLWGSAGLGIPYDEDGLMSLIEYPRLWRECAERQVEHDKPAIDAQVAAGADAFWDGSDWAYKTRPLISPATYREIFLEPMKELVRYLHSKGMKFIKHTDGNIEVFEKMWFGEIGMDGYHAIEPSAGMDITRLRRDWPGLLLHGNLDCGKLLTLGPASAIEDEVVRLVRELAPKSGWVFSSSNSIHSGVPVEHLFAMIEAIKRHGEYPIGERERLF
jgi:hypothetical protein